MTQRAIFRTVCRGLKRTLFACVLCVFGTVSAYAYTVTYNCNGGGGTAPSNDTATADTQFTPAANTCTSPDPKYAFVGWTVSGTNDVKPAGTPFTWEYNENKTFTAKWDWPFSLTTIELSENDTFQFKITAAGTFYVDCDNGEPVMEINRSGTGSGTYTCTYATGGSKTIRFGGNATGYSTSPDAAAISFNISINNFSNDTNVKKILSISGSLGQIFGTITTTSIGSGQPKFHNTFAYASNMTGTNIDDPNNPNMKYALPPTLFNGIYGAPASHMFAYTFNGCSGLTGSIPPGLFGSLSGNPAIYMFIATFQNCSGLTGSIPAGLFGNLFGEPASSMFMSTFASCSGLTGPIPPGLFGNLYDTPANYMFASTFSGCSGLTGSIPDGLFGNLSGSPAISMFMSTFSGCSGLTGTDIEDQNNPDMNYALPPGLFGNLSGDPASHMFFNTFTNCSGLTGSIPSGLFGNLSNAPAQYMFAGTFWGCSGLTGPIPDGLFGNLTGSPAIFMFHSTFYGCSGLSGPIPAGLFGNLSGEPAQNMFNGTFYGCSGLTGSIPATLFDGIYGTPASRMFSGTFYGCIGLDGFGDKTYVLGSFLSAIDSNTSVSNQATYMFNNTQLDRLCPAGTYNVTREQFNDAARPWCDPCPDGATSPVGATDVSQCGYTLTYVVNAPDGGSTSSPEFVAIGLHNLQDVPSGNGYTCSAWTCETTVGNTSVSVTNNAITMSADTTCSSTCSANTINLIWDPVDADNPGDITPITTCEYGVATGTGSITGVQQPTRVGYTFTGWLVRNWHRYLLDTLDPNINGLVNRYYCRVSENVGAYSGFSALYQSAAYKTWAISVADGIIKGRAKCSNNSGNTLYTTGNLSNENGQYCWCNITSYTSASSVEETYDDLPWVYVYAFDNQGGCNNGTGSCTCKCAELARTEALLRSALYGQSE